MLPVIIILWLMLSLAVATFGHEHRFGFWGLLFCSILLTPIVGFIVLLGGSRARYDHTHRK